MEKEALAAGEGMRTRYAHGQVERWTNRISGDISGLDELLMPVHKPPSIRQNGVHWCSGSAFRTSASRSARAHA